METLVADNRLPPGRMLFVHLRLGKAYDDLGEHQRAFEHWLLGNTAKRREIRYDEAVYYRSFQAVAARYPADLFGPGAAQGDSSQLPIFIVGMPRSGSTLVEQILASHPQVHAAGEIKNLFRILQKVADPAAGKVPFPPAGQPLDAELLSRLARSYLTSLPVLTERKTRITDKLLANFLQVGLIHLMLPQARIIHTLARPG